MPHKCASQPTWNIIVNVIFYRTEMCRINHASGDSQKIDVSIEKSFQVSESFWKLKHMKDNGRWNMLNNYMLECRNR